MRLSKSQWTPPIYKPCVYGTPKQALCQGSTIYRPIAKEQEKPWHGMLRNVSSYWNISNKYLCKYVSTGSTRVVEKFVVCGRHLRKTFRRCLGLSDGSDFLISSHSHVTPRPFPYLSPFIGHRSPSLWISRYISILDFCPNHSGISILTDTDLRSLLLGRFSCYHWA